MIPFSEEICGKSTLGTQFWRVHSVGYNAGCRWQYGSIFIWFAVVASQSCEIPRNSL